MMMLMAELTKPGSEKAFRDIGVDIKNAEGGVRSLKDIMLQLDVQRKKIGDVAMLETIGGKGAIGKRSIKPVLAMLRSMEDGIPGLGKGADAWNNLQKEMANSSEQMARAKELFLAMHGTSIRLLKEALIKIAITLGDQLLPAVGALAKSLKWVVETIDEWVKSSPMITGMLKSMMIVGTVTAGFWAFKAAMYGAVKLFAVVQSNLQKASIDTATFAGRIRVAWMETGKLTAELGLLRGGLARVGTAAKVAGSSLKTSLANASAGAIALGKQLAVVYSLTVLLDSYTDKEKRVKNLIEWKQLFNGKEVDSGELSKEYTRLIQESGKKVDVSWWLFGKGLDESTLRMAKENVMQQKLQQQRSDLHRTQETAQSRKAQQEKEHIVSLLDAFRFGSNKMNAVADRFDTIMGYKPKIFSEQAMGNANLAMARAAKKTRDPNDVLMIQVAQAMLPIIKSNMDLAQRGILGASGLATTKEMMADRFALLTHLTTKGLISKGTLEGSRKNMGAMGQMGTKGNLEFGRRLFRLGLGVLPQGKGGEQRGGPELDPSRLEGTPAYRDFYKEELPGTSSLKESSKSVEQSVGASLMSLNATLLDVQKQLDKFWSIPQAVALASDIQGARKALEATTPWISSIAGEVMKSDPIKALGKLGSALFGD